MARHRRRRHYRGIVAIPGLGSIKDMNPLGKTVNATNVLIGAGVGAVGGLAVKYAVVKAVGLDKLPAVVVQNLEALTAVGAGVAGYMFYRKKNKMKGTAILLGSLIAAVVGPVRAAAVDALKGQFPELAGMVDLNLGGYRGFLRPDSGYRGLLTQDMRGLQAYGMRAGLTAEQSYPEM